MPRTYKTPLKNRKCEYADCGRKHFAKGYCTKHYARLQKNGSPHIVMGKPRGSLATVCTAIDCGRWNFAYGYCSMHHQRKRRHGGIESKRLRGTPGLEACVVRECGDPIQTRDYCASHYSRLLRYGTPTGGLRKNEYHRIPDDARCTAADCDQRPKARGLCKRHYDRLMYRMNTDRYRAYDDARRARMAELQVATFTAEQFRQKMAYWGDRCWMCGGRYEADDHVKPVSKGGGHVLANFRPACKSCNSRKGAKWYGVANLHRFVRTAEAA